MQQGPAARRRGRDEWSAYAVVGLLVLAWAATRDREPSLCAAPGARPPTSSGAAAIPGGRPEDLVREMLSHD